MEFNEKLQLLRKQKDLTQEELAEALYVSRTAISKWESGRGYPNIDSLKAISRFFSVTIDELLSGEELLTIAEENEKQNQTLFRNIVFGLLDLSTAMFLFLPLFGENSTGMVHSVSLLSLSMVSTYLRTSYLLIVLAISTVGILTLALQECSWRPWVQHKTNLSLIFHIAGVLLFIISSQPYAAAIVFIYLIIKVLLLIKKR